VQIPSTTSKISTVQANKNTKQMTQTLYAHMNKRKNKLKKKKNTKQPPVLVRTCWSWNFHACWWGAEQGSHHGK
jgi:hypothetical protein